MGGPVIQGLWRGVFCHLFGWGWNLSKWEAGGHREISLCMLAEFLVVAEHWLVLRVLAMLSSCFGVVDCLPCGPSLDRITRRSCSVEVVNVRGPSLSLPSSAIDRLVGVISCWARASLVFCQLEVVVVSFTCFVSPVPT